ncbi:MAG: hypothetical protein PHS59_00725 [Paludibacter sp.]|nr:hypothetical protein [Paludibacter sp.]
MKTTAPYILLMLTFSLFTSAQKMINDLDANNIEAIQQLSTSGLENILNFQNLNNTTSNYVMSQQIGNSNTINVNQQNTGNLNSSNKSFSFQVGNSNELSLGQIGSNNILLGYQMGQTSASRIQANGFQCSIETSAQEGERNRINITQEGINNGVMSVQQGVENELEVQQIGMNNYLMTLQRGTKNSIAGFKQENQNTGVLVDKIIQVGDNLEFKTNEFAKSKTQGNNITQAGTNLSLELNNGMLNNKGGLEVSQKGNDMKVLIDQSYFAFPLK